MKIQKDEKVAYTFTLLQLSIFSTVCHRNICSRDTPSVHQFLSLHSFLQWNYLIYHFFAIHKVFPFFSITQQINSTCQDQHKYARQYHSNYYFVDFSIVQISGGRHGCWAACSSIPATHYMFFHVCSFAVVITPFTSRVALTLMFTVKEQIS